MSRLNVSLSLCLVASTWSSLAAPADALEPAEIAVVVARGNAESVGLGRYYCQKRGVPEAHLIEVDVPPGETIPREQWRWAVRPEIKKWLKENDPDQELRCLVTTWGVPLRITEAGRDAEDQAYLAYLIGEREQRVETLERIRDALDTLAGGATLDASQRDVKPLASLPLADLQKQLESALRDAQVRIGTAQGDSRRGDEARLQQLATAAGGAQVLLQGLAQRVRAIADAGGEVPQQSRSQLDLLRGRGSALNEVRFTLDQLPPGFHRDWLTLRLLEQTGGLLATLEWLDKAIKTAERNETGAALDSELSLVLWEDGYELLRWQPNYLRQNFEGSGLRTAFPTLMVSRLDGPTIEVAKRLVDDAIAVEEAGGLTGKVYLDARGLTQIDGPPLEPGSYPDYDRALLVTARGLESLKDEAGEARFDVTLNELPELFAPGQCPETGLYCGWYSLAKYVDAFDFNRGAVAYHMASGEAATLKELDSQAWCKELLKDGVAATIGPVYEPYLLAFPRPNDFFGLLVQGDLPLVEVYYRTKPFGSWMMTLIGDPLYRPFMAN